MLAAWHELRDAHNNLTDLLGDLVTHANAALQETAKQAGVDYESAAWPALWAHLEKLPVAIGAVRDQINAMLDSMVEHLNDEADD